MVNFIKYMVGKVKSHDVVVPAPPDGLQPLHAIYSRKCMPSIKRLIDEDRLKITGFYRNAKVLEIPAGVITTFDPADRMFFNVNSPDDLGKIR